MKVGYIRVSTVDQNTDRQLDGVELDRVFKDKCSGKDKNRPALSEMLAFVRSGDSVHVHDISRMARSLEDLLSLVKELTGKGVAVEFHKECLAFTGDTNPMQELMLSMLGAVYQFERSMILERQREGIAKAKEAGKYTGRKPSVDRDQVLELLEGGLSIRKAAAELGIAASTVQRIKAEQC